MVMQVIHECNWASGPQSFTNSVPRAWLPMALSSSERIASHKPSESSFIGGGSGVSSARKWELLELAANFADLVSAAPALMRQWFRDAAAAVRVSWGCISGVGFKVNKL